MNRSTRCNELLADPSLLAEAACPLTPDFFVHDPWLEPGDQARTFIGSDTYSAVHAGGVPRSIVLSPLAGTMTPNPLGFVFEGLRATVTDSDGNTSELSVQAVPVPEPGVPVALAMGCVALTTLRAFARCA